MYPENKYFYIRCLAGEKLHHCYHEKLLPQGVKANPSDINIKDLREVVAKKEKDLLVDVTKVLSENFVITPKGNKRVYWHTDFNFRYTRVQVTYRVESLCNEYNQYSGLYKNNLAVCVLRLIRVKNMKD